MTDKTDHDLLIEVHTMMGVVVDRLDKQNGRMGKCEDAVGKVKTESAVLSAKIAATGVILAVLIPFILKAIFKVG